MGKRYWLLDFDDVGYNFRMTDAQAAVGLVQLAKLDGFNRRRQEIADIYRARLSKMPGLCACRTSRHDTTHVYHVFCVLVEPEFPLDKEDFMWELYTRPPDQGLVALHADPPDHGLSQPGPSRRRMPARRSAVPQVRQPADPSAADRRGASNTCWRASRPWHDATSDFERAVASCATVANCSSASSRSTIARSPGRLDLMGGNDDYTGGMVFEATIREATWAAVQLRGRSPRSCS